MARNIFKNREPLFTFIVQPDVFEEMAKQAGSV
jgi:hypothetical protein